MDGERDVLGMWFQETEGAKFWMQVLTDLKHRGVQDILIACVDGLKGFPEAIEAIFPNTTVQTCIVHLIGQSLKYVPRREREQVARDLKPIYTAIDADHAQAELETFDEKWGHGSPIITQQWLNAWEYVTPFLAFPAEVRRVIYTTNAIEALTGSCARRSRRRAASRTRTPPASSSTSCCRTRPRNGRKRGTGRQRCWRSRSTSVTASRTVQTDRHALNPGKQLNYSGAAHTENRDTLKPGSTGVVGL